MRPSPLARIEEVAKASYPRDDNPPDRKKAGNDPASMQSLWQGLVAAEGAGVAPAKAVGGVVIGA